MIKRTVTLIEHPNGWSWAEYGLNYRSLVSAKRAVTKDDKLRPAAHGGCIPTLNYKSNTRAGTLLVKALLS
jgi:hypothetical protein